ncbi:unnamed protein product [Blepharisma stoltei]|uniref:Calponin-homology (CH) domain-containing protein n=1 Tax=Blepharisma stoltei TaxID=1481888 RepID=A0AAU9KI52_9CILI|nr:unnamed protein product [Blepharisma stoltei]
MDLPEHLYNWLQTLGIIPYSDNAESDRYSLPEEIVESLESGDCVTLLVKHLNQIKNNFERLTTPIPELNTLKPVTNLSAKLYNWNIIVQALQLLGVTIDPDTKSLIVAGDREMITEVLEQIYQAAKPQAENPPPQPTQVYKKAITTSEGGVIIDSIDSSKPLFEADTCLEFFILSFCHNFNITPKQAAGLLTQGYKYLAHIVAKGLKGDFEPVIIWLQDIYSNTERLHGLIQNEISGGSMNFVLSAFKPGLISKEMEASQWTYRVYSKLCLELAENDSLKEAWNWFINGTSCIELCLKSLKRHGNAIFPNLVEFLLQIGQQNYVELFTLHLRNAIPDSKEYLNLMNDFLPLLSESQTAYDDIADSGVVGYWLELGMREAESGQNHDPGTRSCALYFLLHLLTEFFPKISSNEILVNAVLSLLNRTCRDESKALQNMAVGMLFLLLEFFAGEKSNYAPIVYRTLTFLLVENYSHNEMREYLECNFRMTYKTIGSIPVGVLLEPLVKRLQLSEVHLDVFDFDFLVALSQHPSLTVKHAIQLIDIVGKTYLNDLIRSRACGVPFTYLADRFVETEAMQDYLYMFSRYSLNLVLTCEQQNYQVKQGNPKNKHSISEAQMDELRQQRNLILDMISWIVQQWQESLNEKLKNLILQTNYAFFQVLGLNCKSILEVLSLFGEPEQLVKSFEQENAELIVPHEEEGEDEDAKGSENYQIVPVEEGNSENQGNKEKKGQFPWDRAFSDIEKAKKKRLEKELKAKEEEEKKQKALEQNKKKLQKQLEIRKVEQGRHRDANDISMYEEGVATKYIAPPDEITLKEFSSAESDEQEAIDLLLKKYSRVFKILFVKYSGTGHARKNGAVSSFDYLADRKSKLTEAEMIKVLIDHSVIPKLLTKEELKTIMKTYLLKIVKQNDLSNVDYDGFKGLFCQIAWFIYSRNPHDFSHLPAIIPIQTLLDFMRDDMKEKGFSTEMYDDPDPGTGDKDVVKKLNKLLRSNPDTPLPEGYKKIQDKEIDIAYVIPSMLKLPEAKLISLEILDGVLDKTFGVHIIEPLVKFRTYYRAKGIAPKPPEVTLSAPSENIKSKDKLPTIQAQPSIIPKQAKLSPLLKFEIAKAPPGQKDTYEQCAIVLENILHTLHMKSRKFLNRVEVTPNKLEEKFELKKEREKEAEEKKKQEMEKKRKMRQQMLLEEIARAKAERQEKLKIDEEKRKIEKAKEEEKKRKKMERERKEREERFSVAKEVVEVKKEKEVKLPDPEEIIKKQKEEEKNRKKFEEAKRRNAERLQQAIKEKESKGREIKMADITKELKEQQEKIIKQKTTAKILKNAKQSTEKSNQTKQEISTLLHDKDYNEIIDRFSQQIDTVYSFYCKQGSAKIEQDATSMFNSMTFQVFNKFCLQFRIFPGLVTGDEHQIIFKHLTKQKTFPPGIPPIITVDEFKQALAHIASHARTKLNQQAAQGPNMLSAKTFFSLIKYLELDIPVKTLKAKLKKLAEEKPSRINSIMGSAEATVMEEIKEAVLEPMINYEKIYNEDEKKAKILEEEEEEAILQKIFESKNLSPTEEGALQDISYPEYND